METNTDVSLLHEKIDYLSALLEAQQRQLDLLTQVAEVQRRQIEEFQELKRDLTPILNHMVKLAIQELAEVGSEFQAEDLLFLLKRLLRDTHLIVEGLDRLEMMMELYDELQRNGKQVFNHLVARLDRMERQGYFAFARQGWRILETIVEEFSEDDVRALGDNIVLILNTIKDMTQPEVLQFVRNTLLVAEQEVEKPVDSSLLGLLRQMRDPNVRRGLALTLRVLHVIGAQAEAGSNGRPKTLETLPSATT